jgi:hypothetical protein
MIRRTGAGSLRLFSILALLLSASCGGCDDPPPVDETFDGNVVIGDATPAPDGSPEEDTGETELDGSEDSGMPDAEEDGGGPLDLGVDDAGIDCFPEISGTFSATTAFAEAAALDQQFLEITGTATVAQLTCTACADAGACSCACTATAAIDGLVLLEESPCFASPGCSGNECTQVCRPPVLGAEQRFRGRLNMRNSGPEKSVTLELFSVSP